MNKILMRTSYCARWCGNRKRPKATFERLGHLMGALLLIPINSNNYEVFRAALFLVQK